MKRTVDSSRRGRGVGWAAALLAAAGFALPAAAMFATPNDAPVDRLVKNLSAHVKEHPKDAQGFYVLGRVHSLAYVLKEGTVRVYDDPEGKSKLPIVDHPFNPPGGDLLEFVPDLRKNPPGEGGAEKPEEKSPREKSPADAAAERLTHLDEALSNFRKAIELDSKQGLFHLGLAYTLEEGAKEADDAPPGAAVPEKVKPEDEAKHEEWILKLADADFKVREYAQDHLKEAGLAAVPALRIHREDKDDEVKSRVRDLFQFLWREEAIAGYRKAHDLSVALDLKTSMKPPEGLKSLVAYEAGQSYVRLMKERGAAEKEKKEVEKVQKNLAAIEKIPPGPITPIVFPLDGCASLADLLAPGNKVSFDLDGDGRAETIPWVRPDVGILAWDPAGDGRIASGRRLFGSVTWWIFWTDGYMALSALDDDRDGFLRGSELAGLSVWRDADSNGVSDSGEVVPVKNLGIERIATRATAHDGESPCNPEGLRLRDGRVRPTYDWIVRW